MKKILVSVSIIAAVAAVVVGATTAFFSDTETSIGNTFTAGSIDLKIDNECWWSGSEDGTCPWHEQGNMLANWTLNDLEDGVHKFFHFTDLKPGDWGEDTISLHVFNNDAWGRIYFSNVTDLDNDCTEPESVDECGGEPNCCDDDGELDDYMGVMVWLDQGEVDGFQCSGEGEKARCMDDEYEGDNYWQENEPIIFADITADFSYDLADIISEAYVAEAPGLTEDGHMVGSITYYIGLAWCFGDWDHKTMKCDGSGVNNTPQSDSLSGNLNFQVEQYRNNPTPSW